MQLCFSNYPLRLLCDPVQSAFFRTYNGNNDFIRQTDDVFTARMDRSVMHADLIRAVRPFHLCTPVPDHQPVCIIDPHRPVFIQAVGLSFLRYKQNSGCRFHTRPHPLLFQYTVPRHPC